MRFILNSLSSLFVGGVLGVLFWSFGEGIEILGIPVYLVAATFGMLACAWISIWIRKTDGSLAKLAGGLFFVALFEFLLIGLWVDVDLTSDNHIFIALLGVAKWLMLGSLIFSAVLSLGSMLIPLRENNQPTELQQ